MCARPWIDEKASEYKTRSRIHGTTYAHLAVSAFNQRETSIRSASQSVVILRVMFTPPAVARSSSLDGVMMTMWWVEAARRSSRSSPFMIIFTSLLFALFARPHSQSHIRNKTAERKSSGVVVVFRLTLDWLLYFHSGRGNVRVGVFVHTLFSGDWLVRSLVREPPSWMNE